MLIFSIVLKDPPPLLSPVLLSPMSTFMHKNWEHHLLRVWHKLFTTSNLTYKWPANLPFSCNFWIVLGLNFQIRLAMQHRQLDGYGVRWTSIMWNDHSKHCQWKFQRLTLSRQNFSAPCVTFIPRQQNIFILHMSSMSYPKARISYKNILK